MPRMQRRKKGGALISALFITAICAMIATALADRGGVIIRDGELVKNTDQTYLNMQRVQDWAKDQIKTFLSQWVDLPNNQQPATLKTIQWQFRQEKMGRQTIAGNIFDAQGRYNINDLVLSANQPQFEALIEAVSPSISQKHATEIAQAVTDWMTKGTLDKIYLKQKPAYRASRQQMADKTELRMVAGVSAGLYNKLRPYIVALPVQVSDSSNSNNSSSNPSSDSSGQSQASSQGQPPAPKPTAIDINAAKWPVWMAIIPNLEVSQAKALVACRKRYRYFTNVSDFKTECVDPLGVKMPDSENLVTHSQYFLFQSTASQGETTIHFDSLLMPQVDKNNKINVNIIWQSFY